MALEGTKATIATLEAKVDELNQVIGTQKAEISKLKKSSGKKTATSKATANKG